MTTWLVLIGRICCKISITWIRSKAHRFRFASISQNWPAFELPVRSHPFSLWPRRTPCTWLRHYRTVACDALEMLKGVYCDNRNAWFFWQIIQLISGLPTACLPPFYFFCNVEAWGFGPWPWFAYFCVCSLPRKRSPCGFAENCRTV